MRHVSATIQVPATRDRVFAFVADPANLPDWQVGIVSVERTSAGPIGVGSTAHVVRELMGRRLSVDLRVSAYEPDRRLGLESAAAGIEVEGILELTTEGDATAVTFHMAIRAQNPFLAPLEGMVAGAAEHDLADSLRRLRDRLSPT